MTAALGTDARALAGAFATLALMRRLAWVPRRRPVPDSRRPDIQFDLGPAVPEPVVVEGVQIRFPPVHTVFATARLGGTPTMRDQDTLRAALEAIEEAYPWSPAGVLTHLAYGMPYFRRLPAGLFSLHMPRLLSNTNRFVLEEPGAAPADRGAAGRGAVAAAVGSTEHNDVLVTLRGDDPGHVADVLGWLAGSDDLAGRQRASPRFDAGLEFTSGRAMFLQVGLPRQLAGSERLPYAVLVNPRSAAWMGAGEPDGSAPASQVVFRGTAGVRYTTALAGDYFDHGAVQHLAHEALDLQRFYGVGGPGGDAEFIGRVQRLFRDRDREVATPGPVHQRLDGPGFDDLDVPGGGCRPKNQSCVFVPSVAALTAMRPHGLERFLTTTRRQSFLVPPGRHRAFPLLELG